MSKLITTLTLITTGEAETFRVLSMIPYHCEPVEAVEQSLQQITQSEINKITEGYRISRGAGTANWQPKTFRVFESGAGEDSEFDVWIWDADSNDADLIEQHAIKSILDSCDLKACLLYTS